MAITTQDMINAGALRQLCLYHARRTATDKDWAETRQYAIREFRDIPISVIDGLIEHCVQATNAAQGYQLGLGLPDSFMELVSTEPLIPDITV